MPSRRTGLFVSLTLAAVQFATAQTVVNSVFTPNHPGYYGTVANWSPPEVPNNSPEKIYNVTIPGFVRMDVDATISNLTMTGSYFAEDHSLTVLDSSNLKDFSISVAASLPAGATFAAGSLSSFSAGSLTGRYSLSNSNTNAGWTTLQFDGAHVTTLSNAQVTLYGPRTRIVDESGNDALRDLARIESDSSLGMVGHQLTVAGPFTNDGELGIGSSLNQAGLFSILGTLTNFDASSRTLTGGIYNIAGSYAGAPNLSGVLKFAGADIVHNAASLFLSGPLAGVEDQNGNDGLRNFAHNASTGTFSVGGRDYSIAGNFSNDGILKLYSGRFSVEGSLTNFDPATRTLTGGTYELNGPDVTFVFPGADIVNNAASIDLDGYGYGTALITDENGNDALRNFTHNLPDGVFTIFGNPNFTPPADFTNEGAVNIFCDCPTNRSEQAPPTGAGNHTYLQTAGSTYFASAIFAGDMVMNGGSFTTSGTNAFGAPPSQLNGNLTIGDALFAPLNFIVSGTVQLSASSRFIAPQQGFNNGIFRVTGTFTAGGTLQINPQGAFPPSSTATYTAVLAEGGVIGTFSNAPNGARVPTNGGLGSFIVNYTPNTIFLSDFQALPPAAQLLNVSSRVQVLTGDNAPIGGFIVFGRDPKKVIMRGLGPSLTGSGVGGALQNPILELHRSNGVVIASNDNWRDTQETDIQASGLAPSDDRESAIIATLLPGAYTAILRGTNNTTGAGLVEIYDLEQAVRSKLGNLSTRGFVDSDNHIIGGFIAGGSGEANAELVVRALGPKLSSAHVPGFLPDPTLELRNSQGILIGFNDDCGDAPENFQRIPPGLYLFNSKDAALPASLPAGNYTAIVRGKAGASGIAVVEVYDLNR